MLGVFAVVPCGCVVAAPVLSNFVVVICGCVVAGSVGSDAPLLLLCSVGLAEVCARSEASETATEKGKKLDVID